MRSEIRFLRTAEGVRVAYRVLGDGRNPRGRGGEPRVARGVSSRAVGAHRRREVPTSGKPPPTPSATAWHEGLPPGGILFEL